MIIKQTDIFAKWFRSLRDERAKARILARIARLELGNPGNVRDAGEGISEMKIDYGPGYRLYYKRTGHAVVLLLVGGDKSTQDADIRRAKALAKELRI